MPNHITNKINIIDGTEDEILRKLTKEELLQLFEDKYFILRITEQDIKTARGRVLLKRAEKAFQLCEKEYNACLAALEKDPPDLATYHQKSADAERNFERYETLCARGKKMLYGK